MTRIFVCIFFLFSYCPRVFAQAEAYPKEGWVTFATRSYFDLLEVMIASVHEFSSRPVIAVGVNADIPFSTDRFPQLIKKRIDVSYNFATIFSEKPRCILESGLEYGIYIEADDILAPGCDELFEYAHLERRFPLCPIHPNPPNNQFEVMNLLDVQEKTMPYVHGHVVFSSETLPFVEEWYQTCLDYIRRAPNADETILNVLLWKHGAVEYVPLYDPFYENVYSFMKLSKSERLESPYTHWKMFHGCKHPPTAWKILEFIEETGSTDL